MARILNVDDVPVNRQLLAAFLEPLGHEIIDAGSGEQAIELARELRPDLVLLDVMMPGLDGFETARVLKDQAGQEYLPIIFLTSLTDSQSRLRGLRAGADDFLTKPIDQHQLVARVANLLTLRAKELALLKSNVELIELHRFRDEMHSLIVHDLKSPLTVVLSNLEFVLADPEVLPADVLEALGDAADGGRRVMQLVANLLDLAQIEVGRFALRKTSVPLASLVKRVVHQRQRKATARNLRTEVLIGDELMVSVDEALFTRVVENIVDNAQRHAPEGGLIRIEATSTERRFKLTIANSGPAIPLEGRAKIFEKFGQASNKTGRMNLGLGLYFCRMAVEAHGGCIAVEEQASLPTVLAIEIPR
jgi:two-component system, sensor histidine kinase and response regulator